MCKENIRVCFCYCKGCDRLVLYCTCPRCKLCGLRQMLCVFNNSCDQISTTQPERQPYLSLGTTPNMEVCPNTSSQELSLTDDVAMEQAQHNTSVTTTFSVGVQVDPTQHNMGETTTFSVGLQVDPITRMDMTDTQQVASATNG
jgi:hypothetical protein